MPDVGGVGEKFQCLFRGNCGKDKPITWAGSPPLFWISPLTTAKVTTTGHQVMDLFLPIAQEREEGFQGIQLSVTDLAFSLERVAGSAMRIKLCFCEAVQHSREDIGLWSLMDLVSNPVPPLPGCAALYRCLPLAEPEFLHLINRNNSPYLRVDVRIQCAKACTLEQHLTQTRWKLKVVKTILDCYCSKWTTWLSIRGQVAKKKKQVYL